MLLSHESSQQPAFKIKEKLFVSMRTHMSRIDKWKGKRNTLNPFEPEQKDASSSHAKDEYPRYSHQPL